MGHYTRIKFDAAVSAAAPSQVIDVLRWIASRRDGTPPVLPDHPLFHCEHWDSLGYGSASFWGKMPPAPALRLADGAWQFTFECALRNYDDDIQKFLDWIGPQLVTPPGIVIGETETEDQRYGGSPTILIAQAGTVVELREPAEQRDSFWGFGPPGT